MSELTFMRKSGPLFTDKKTGEVRQGLAFMHYCAHGACLEWGSFGFGVNLKAKQPGVWYCRQHLPPQGLTIDGTIRQGDEAQRAEA